MAAVTPVTKGTAGYVPPGFMYLNDAGASPDTLTDAAAEHRIVSTAGLKHERFYFPDVDNTELWTTPPGVVAVAVQILASETAIQTTAVLNANRQVLWSNAASNCRAILHTWSRGERRRASGTNVTPVTKGTSGYHAPGSTLLRSAHDGGSTDPLATDQNPPFALTAAGKLCSTSNGSLRHVVLYFTGLTGVLTSTWTPNARTMPRIVDYAWQPVGGVGTDRILPALGATQIDFYGDDDADGWLHLWLRG